MNLEISSLSKASKYVPSDKSGIIRIFDSFTNFFPDLKESPNWIDVEKEVGEYSFDDVWPDKWKEYSWVNTNDPYFEGILPFGWKVMKDKYPKMTKESLMSYLEHEGHVTGRKTLFDEKDAKRIFEEYDKYWKDADTLVIHCRFGINRAPAIGIAMNEIYNLGMKGLKEKHPNYRRYIYDVMMRTAEDLNIK